MKSYLLILLFAVLSCTDEQIKPEVDLSVSGDSIAAQESWDSKILFTENGNLNAILLADHISVFDNRSVTYIDGVHLDFYDDKGEKTTTLTSLHGRVNEMTRNMFAIDSVVAVSDSGVTLLTDELMWRNHDHKIVTDRFVTIINEKERIEGYGFESDEHLINYTIFKITYMTKLKD